MNCVFIRGIALPGRVRGVTVIDEQEDYNVYINTNLCPETQRKTIEHEMIHIKADHFYNEEPVVYNELQANSV